MNKYIQNVRYNKIYYYDRFCNVPFRDLKIKDNGDIYFCAWSDQNGMPPLGNIFKTKNLIRDIWNGNMAKQFRESVLNGSFKFCGDYCCHLISGTGPVSIKNDKAKILNDYFTQGINEHEHKCIENKITTLENYPINLTLATSSKCNLKCTSCRSDFITKDSKTEEEWKLLETRRMQFLENAETIFLGSYGEITVNELDTKMLRNYIEKELKNIKSIVIQTNGVLFTKEYWEKINDFIKRKITRIEISVDAATEKTYDINRPGGNWKKLWENIEFLSKLQKTWIQLNFVVQNNNYVEIIPFIKLARQYGVMVHFQLLYNWGTYSKDEFNERDVLNPSHYNYNDLLKRLLCEEFAGNNVINDLALGNNFNNELLKYKNICRKKADLPFSVYSHQKQCGYKLMGEKNGISLLIDNHCYDKEGFYVMRLHSKGNESWAGIYFLASEIFALNDRSKSIEFINASKIKFVLKASKNIFINEIGFGEKTDSHHASIKDVEIGMEYCNYEIDLKEKNLSDINGLFYISTKSNFEWDIFIKEITIY
ncbi:MAG: radical SAM protein [Endomicrobia bacterium]|nr:radical SAM protein [Endomicrobiia bacterium]